MHRIVVQSEDFSVSEEWRACFLRIKGKAGAIVAFCGMVRDMADMGKVDSLYLEHYPGMTESSIQSIIDDAVERWTLMDVSVIHRIGVLKPADQIVLLLTAAPHRSDAFAACEFIMDNLKTRAVFWKKEVRTDGASWVKSTSNDYTRAENWDDYKPPKDLQHS